MVLCSYYLHAGPKSNTRQARVKIGVGNYMKPCHSNHTHKETYIQQDTYTQLYIHYGTQRQQIKKKTRKGKKKKKT